MNPFSITCMSCRTRLRVTDPELVGQIQACPKCGCMVEIAPPPGWQPSAPKAAAAIVPAQGVPVQSEPVAAKPSTPVEQSLENDQPTAPDQSETLAPGATAQNLAPLAPKTLGSWLPWACVGAAAIACGVMVYIAVSGAPPMNDALPVTDTPQITATSAESVITGSPTILPTEPPLIEPVSAVPPLTPTTRDSEPIVLPDSAANAAPTLAVAETPMPKKPDVAPMPTQPIEAQSEPAPRPVVARRPASPHPARSPLPHVDVAARLADPVTAIQLKDVSLADFARFVSQATTAPVTLDVDSLAAAGISPAMKVSFDARDVDWRGALASALEPQGLFMAEEPGHIIISARDPARSEPASERYEVADLATGGLATTQALRMFVMPTRWNSAGGLGSARVDGAAIIVEQPEDVQRRVFQFLERWRVARGLPLRDASAADRISLAPRYTALDGPLTTQVSIHFPASAPLDQILSLLARQAAIAIALDRCALAEAGIAADAPARLVLHDRPLSDALSALLKPLELDYRVVDGATLEVTTAQGAAERLEIEFPRVNADRAVAAQNLVARLQRDVAPEVWSDAGGMAEAVYDPASGRLIISAPQRVQREVARWLSR